MADQWGGQGYGNTGGYQGQQGYGAQQGGQQVDAKPADRHLKCTAAVLAETHLPLQTRNWISAHGSILITRPGPPEVCVAIAHFATACASTPAGLLAQGNTGQQQYGYGQQQPQVTSRAQRSALAPRSASCMMPAVEALQHQILHAAASVDPTKRKLKDRRRNGLHFPSPEQRRRLRAEQQLWRIRPAAAAAAGPAARSCATAAGLRWSWPTVRLRRPAGTKLEVVRAVYC